MNLTQCKRIVMFNLVTDPESGEPTGIEFRHYGISARQRSINKSIKRLVNTKKVPNLARYDDIADFIYSRGMGYSSESEAEDIPEGKITLPEDFQDKKKNSTVAIKLHELGPRLKLRLLKIEEGVCRGNVVFHQYVKLSKKEIKEQMDELKSKREQKAERKRVQAENVKRKTEEKEAKLPKRYKAEEVVASEEEGEPKKRVKFTKPEEKYADVDIDESRDKRAMPKGGIQRAVKKNDDIKGTVLGKKRPRPAAK
jgi:ribosome biogenesis protein SSF1/2